MSSKGQVISVNVSAEKGTIKTPVESIEIDSRGVVGDAHAGMWHRQVSVLSAESIDAFVEQSGRQTAPGEFAENITVRGVGLTTASVLDRFRIGDVELELTQIGKDCHGHACEIFKEVGRCVMPTEGVFCRVVTGGSVRPGDEIEHVAKALRILVITLSDRASAGEYEDRSGPEAARLLGEFFAPTRWREQIETLLLPDEPGRLDAALREAIAGGVDIIFTLGSTGVGPRDIAPEVVEGVCEKVLPGIMEHIRAKFGADKPAARLSRSVAGVAGATQIYAVPGSVRAVSEYLPEILETVEHVLFTLHGLDRH